MGGEKGSKGSGGSGKGSPAKSGKGSPGSPGGAYPDLGPVTSSGTSNMTKGNLLRQARVYSFTPGGSPFGGIPESQRNPAPAADATSGDGHKLSLIHI